MSNLEKLRNVYYEMLDEVFSIADRHNIPVFLCAGTLLGAIRHKDFIPWDNDVDVVMFRSDFEKLKPFLTAELDPDKYELIEPGFFGNRFLKMVPFIRYRHASWATREEVKKWDDFYSGKAAGLHFDFFLFDRIPDNFAGTMQKWHIMFLFSLLNGHRHSVPYYNYSPMVKAVAFFLQLMGKLFSAKWLIKRFETVAARYNSNTNVNSLVVTNDCMESFSFRFPASWYEGDRKEAFGQKKYHVPVEAEKALTEHFGDWNTLPPESERVFHEYADRMIETTEDDYVFYDEIT